MFLPFSTLRFVIWSALAISFLLVPAHGVDVRPPQIEFAMMYDVDSPAGRYAAVEQLSGLRTAAFVLRDLVPGVNVTFRLVPSPPRNVTDNDLRLAVENTVQSNTFFGYVLSDRVVSGYLINATRAAGVPLIAPHKIDESGFRWPQDRHVIHFQQGALRDTLTMLDHALQSADTQAARVALFLRLISGWEDIVDAVTLQMTRIGFDAPAVYVWGLTEPFNATDAVSRWVSGATNKSSIPTAALVFLFPEDVGPLISAAWHEPQIDWESVAFYTSALEINGAALSLSWDPTATVQSSPTARAVFRRLHLVTPLGDVNDRSVSLVDYYGKSRTAFFAANVSQSELPNQPYATTTSRSSYAGFVVGYSVMRTLGTMLDLTSTGFVNAMYGNNDQFLNRTYLGPFHDFCSSETDSRCFCNVAFYENTILTLNVTTGLFRTDLNYKNVIQEKDQPVEHGYCVDKTAVKLRYPIGMYIVPTTKGATTAAREASLAGMQLEASELQTSEPLNAGYLSVVPLNHSLWTQYPDPKDLFLHLAVRFLPLILVSDAFDPVALNIDLVALRWSMDLELQPPPLQPATHLSDRVIQWSPYLADFVHATSAYLNYLYNNNGAAATPRVWVIGESEAMITVATMSLHTFQFPVWRSSQLGTLECSVADTLIESWLSEAASLPELQTIDGSVLRPLVVVVMLNDVALGTKLLERFAVIASGRLATQRLLLVCPWQQGIVFEALQALRSSSSMVPSDSAVVFASNLPAFWLPLSEINIEMRKTKGTADVSVVENPYTINGLLATRLTHSIAQYLEFGEANAASFLDVLYQVKTFSLLGVTFGPYYRNTCDNQTLMRNDASRTCQCYNSFRRFYVFDLLDWATGREAQLTNDFFMEVQGCSVHYRPLVVPVVAKGLSTAQLAGIGVGASVGLLLLLFAVYHGTRAGRGRDVRRAPKNPNKPCAIVFTDIQSSTSLWARAPGEMSEAVEQHHRIIRAALDKHDGYEVKTIGDSFMCAFRKAEDAFRFALAVETGMAAATWPAAIDDVYEQLAEEIALENGAVNNNCKNIPQHERYGLRVRVGAHWGVACVQYDEVAVGYDYYGTVVNTAARVEGVGHGGQVLVTADLWRELEEVGESSSGVLSGVDVKPLGPQPLRGLDQPLPLYQVLPLEFAHRRFGALRLDSQAEEDDEDDDTSSCFTESTDASRATRSQGQTVDSRYVRSRMQLELKKKPHLLGVATASLQVLEALLSTSTAAWREETLRQVCKKWRITYEKPKTTEEASLSGAAAVDAFAKRKDIILLIAKSVVAADLKKKIVTGQHMDEEVSFIQNRRRSINTVSLKKAENDSNAFPFQIVVHELKWQSFDRNAGGGGGE